MGLQLELLREAAISSVQSIQQQYQDSDITVEVGVVVYSDYSDAPGLDAEAYRTSQTSACSHIDPTTDYQVVQDFINGLQLSGGGDIAEAVELALHRVNAMSPDFVHMILDAPPHAFVTRSDSKGGVKSLYFQSDNYYDDYKDEKKIPSELHYLSELAELSKSGAIVNSNVCNHARKDARAFAGLVSNTTGGVGIYLKYNDKEKFKKYCSKRVIQLLEERPVLTDFINRNRDGIIQYSPDYLEELLCKDEQYKEFIEQCDTSYIEEDLQVLDSEWLRMVSYEIIPKLESLLKEKDKEGMVYKQCKEQLYTLMESADKNMSAGNSNKDPKEINTMNCGIRVRRLYEKLYPAESKVSSEVEVHNAEVVTNRPAQPMEVV